MFKKVLTAVFFVLALSICAFAQDSVDEHSAVASSVSQTASAQSAAPQSNPKFISFALCMLAGGMALGLAGLGVAVGQGLSVAKAVEAIGRNPEAQPKIQTLLLIGLAFLETIAIYGLVFGLLLVFSNPIKF